MQESEKWGVVSPGLSSHSQQCVIVATVVVKGKVIVVDIKVAHNKKIEGRGGEERKSK